MDQRLKKICLNKYILCMEAMRMVIGKKFFFSNNRTRENSDIASCFLVSLLDLNLLKLRCLILLRMVFKATILLNDVDVVAVA